MPLQEWVGETLQGRSSHWMRFVGSGVITLLSVLLVALLWRGMGAINDPGLLLLFTVAASTYLAGGMAGMLSAAIVLFCSFVLFSHPLYPFRYSELDWRQMMVIVVACPVLALMVGSLKEQIDRLKLITREALALKEEIRRFDPIKEAQFQCEQRFHLMTDFITDHAVCQLDANGAVSNWNIGAERLLGYPAAEIVGQSYSRFFTKEDILARHPERLMEQARFSSRAGQEAWRIRKGGTRLHCRTSIIALRTQQGAPGGFLLVIYDLTRVEEANLAALKAQAELEALKHRIASTGSGPDAPN